MEITTNDNCEVDCVLVSTLANKSKPSNHHHKLNYHHHYFSHCKSYQTIFVTILSLQIVILSNQIGLSSASRCEIAREKCAYRSGCGFSLHSYMVECADLIAGRTNQCHPRCERALIGLVSSEEGKELINCDCESSKFCEQSKERTEVCRQAVQAAVAKDSIVSCNTARWICTSDPLCSTALEYYHIYCRGLFHGHKCSHRCNNSLSILNRQEKAAKLRTCYCEGNEDFPCQRVKYNTERYCYGRPVLSPFDESTTDEEEYSSNAIDGAIDSGDSSYNHRYNRRKHSKHRNVSGAAALKNQLLSIALMAVFLWDRYQRFALLRN